MRFYLVVPSKCIGFFSYLVSNAVQNIDSLGSTLYFDRHCCMALGDRPLNI